MIKTKAVLAALDLGLMPPSGEYENPGIRVLCDLIWENRKQMEALTKSILIMAEVERDQ